MNMKFETLKRDYRKPILIIAGVAVAITATVFFVGTRAKYRYTASIQAAKGTINYDEPDLWITALYIEQEDGSYKSSESVPTSGYALNETETYCGYSSDNGLVKDDGVKVTYENGNIKISDITKSGVKCHLYFDKEALVGGGYIVDKFNVSEERISGEFTSIYEADTGVTKTIFKGPADDYGETTYFFAGKDPNNWVQFANKWWRIIRINGDGSIRLIYSGSDSTTEPQLTGEDTQIGTSAFNEQNNDNAYVGYMYGQTGQNGDNAYALTHTNTNSSTIKGALDTWYVNNIGNNTTYSSKIELNVGFCGDRKTAENTWTNYGDLGYGSNITSYAPTSRIFENGEVRSKFIPSIKCTQTNDLYTVSSSNLGNKALTNPVGLITLDEAAFIGAYGLNENLNYWLYTNQVYWTMSPCFFDGSYAGVFAVALTGNIGYNDVSVSYGVRPVINLKADTVLIGSGTTTDPFVVQ